MTSPSGLATRAPALGEPEGRAAPSGLVSLLVQRWLPFLLFLGCLTAVVRRAALPLANPDTYFHLRFGREFLDGWSLQAPGHVTSWSTADWVPTQWLTQEVMAGLEQRFGLPGVAWFAGFQFVLLTVVLFFAARRGADPVVSAPLAVAALLACSSGLSMRPQVLSYVAVTATVWLVLAVRDAPPGTGRRLWLAVPLTWSWAMCHGMWPVGPVVVAVGLLGMVVDGRLRGRELATLAPVPVAGLLAGGVLTPVGDRLLPAVLMVNSRAAYFDEWAPPRLASTTNLALLAMLAVAVVVMVRRGGDWTDVLLVGLAAGFAVYSARTVPLAACMMVPLAATQLQRLLGPPLRATRGANVAVLGSAACALVVLAIAVPTTSATPPPQPGWVDARLGSLPDGTRLLNDRAHGGYLMWRYPDLDFMFSGYGDTYTTDELDTMKEVDALDPGWRDAVAAAAPAYALLDPDSRLAHELRESWGWRVVEDDEDIQLLQPSAEWPGPS